MIKPLIDKFMFKLKKLLNKLYWFLVVVPLIEHAHEQTQMNELYCEPNELNRVCTHLSLVIFLGGES